MLHFELITPNGTVYSGQIEEVQVPGYTGSFAVKRNHAPLISILKSGGVKIISGSNQEQEFFQITGGVLEVQNNHVVLLADQATKN